MEPRAAAPQPRRSCVAAASQLRRTATLPSPCSPRRVPELRGHPRRRQTLEMPRAFSSCRSSTIQRDASQEYARHYNSHAKQEKACAWLQAVPTGCAIGRGPFALNLFQGLARQSCSRGPLRKCEFLILSGVDYPLGTTEALDSEEEQELQEASHLCTVQILSKRLSLSIVSLVCIPRNGRRQ